LINKTTVETRVIGSVLIPGSVRQLGANGGDAFDHLGSDRIIARSNSIDQSMAILLSL
jgi:hypothetical protein